MSDHTRGPWRPNGCEIIGDSRVVATVHWCSGLEAEDDANIALIAAAPDLLAAVSGFHKLSLVLESAVRNADPAYREDVLALIKLSRAAMDRANGRPCEQET